MSSIAIIGAGMGGLSSAISLGARGHDVTVFEAGPRAGGKVGIATHDGVEFDTGPSLLTLPHLLGEVFERAGTSLEDELELVKKELAFRYLYPDGTVLDVHFSPERTRQSVREVLGEQAAHEFGEFLEYARGIWEAAAPNFVLGPAPSIGSVVKLGMRSLSKMMAIDPMSTMARGIEKRVETPELRDLLLRYATYNGSNPFEAPATLNCIAWVELGLGGWGVRGGMYEIARAMEGVARRQGVEFRFDSPVRAVEVDGGRVSGVRTDEGVHACDAAVVNADVAHLIESLMPQSADTGIETAETPSMSGWTAVLRARRRPASQRAPHTVLFPEDYDAEFLDIFERDRPPERPTVYLCAQEKAHARQGWEEHEPIFIMANAPAEPADAERPAEVWASLEATVMSRLRHAGLIDADDQIVWRRTPTRLASQFPGSRGSIYGAASNSKFAAFKRPSNRVERVPGLYLASGSAHPGGGVPLCVQSGKTAAEAVDEDLSP